MSVILDSLMGRYHTTDCAEILPHPRGYDLCPAHRDSGRTDGVAYVESDCADLRSTGTDRIAFCIAYDVGDGVITSARCYGAIGFLGPVGGVDSAVRRTN